MLDTFAIYALRRKRARLAGKIEAAEFELTKKRDTLATVDAVIRLFEPQSNPELSRRSGRARAGDCSSTAVSSRAYALPLCARLGAP